VLNVSKTQSNKSRPLPYVTTCNAPVRSISSRSKLRRKSSRASLSVDQSIMTTNCNRVQLLTLEESLNLAIVTANKFYANHLIKCLAWTIWTSRAPRASKFGLTTAAPCGRKSADPSRSRPRNSRPHPRSDPSEKSELISCHGNPRSKAALPSHSNASALSAAMGELRSALKKFSCSESTCKSVPSRSTQRTMRSASSSRFSITSVSNPSTLNQIGSMPHFSDAFI
jgi:hypothetical protein